MAIIDKANDAHVLMKLLCEKMGLTTKTTHIQFVETFSNLQKDARVYETELRDMFKEGVAKEISGEKLQKQEEEYRKNGTLISE